MEASQDLSAALVAARAGRLDEALDCALAAWARAPHPRLSDVVFLLSARIATPTPAGLRGKKASAIEAWLGLAEASRAADIPALLEALADVSSPDAAERVRAVARWRADPRVDHAVCKLLEDVPYRATSTRPFWKELFALAGRIRDPRLLDRLEGAGGAIATNVADTMAGWLQKKLDRLLGELRPGTGEGPADPALDELEALLSAQAESVGRERKPAEDLLAAVFADPTDDAARLVYADALGERGDPRGELIAVQCRIVAGTSDPKLRRREKELIKAHGKQWLGELAPIIMAGFEFERGFLASCRVDTRKPDLVARLAGHRAWSTVNRLDGSARIGLDPVMVSLRALAVDAGVAAHREGMRELWHLLLGGPERPLVELGYRSGLNDDAELELLAAAPALPALRLLSVIGPAARAAAVLAGPVASRLDRLHLTFDPPRGGGALDPFAAALVAAPIPALAFTLHPDTHPTELELVRLERANAGYHRATLKVGPVISGTLGWSTQLAGEALSLLSALPATVREIDLSLRPHFHAPDAERVSAAARELPGVTVTP